MKTTLKNYLKFGVLLFGVSLILTNCEKDDDNQPKSDLLNKNKSINQTSLSELLNQNFLSEETFGLMAKKQNTSLNDKATEPTFKLSSSKGLKYLDKGNTYHVFLMERTDKTDPYYYNLVVHEHEETLEKYIYKYPLDKTENVTISKITNKDIQSARKSVPVPVVKDLGDGCTETYLYDVTPCPCVGHIDPNICTCPIKPAWKFKGGPYYYCPALDTNNPIIVMPDNNNGVNTSKGITTNDPGGCFSNGNGMTECEPLDERPILLVPLPVFEPDFGKNEGITSTLELSNVQKLWLEKLENLNFKSDIEEYLNQYVFTNKFNQAKAFAISAITALMNSGEVDFDDEIINELTGKALCAYNKLLSSGVSNFHNMITDLFIEFGDSNIGGRDLTFKMSSDLPNNFGGKTQVDSNGNYHILINENLMNTLSSIEVAAILVHEMAHAFLGKHYIDYNSSFTELYEKYINDTGIQNYSHDIMKDQFINRMATAIKNYDSSIFSNFEDYKILASQGVFELTNDQKEDLLTVKLLSRNNDKNCD